MELVSRKKGVKDTHSDDNTLVKNFREAHKEIRVPELFDDEIAVASNLELLHSLAKIALECLNPDVGQRPSMVHVAEQLLLLSRSRNL